MPTVLRVSSLFVLLVLALCTSHVVVAQMETATLSGVVQDPNGRVVPDVEVAATRIETGTFVTTKTNGAGIYFFTGVMPGHYHLVVRKPGFKEIAIKEFELHVQDKLEQNFALEIGSVSETVTVTAATPLINTTDGTVSTVVDRQFAENLPMNGRSFQTLIQLTPGVVPTVSTSQDSGQFSVNGQRATSNYFTVDGVSANIGITAVSGQGALLNGAAGVLQGFSVQGGTNSLVSVDALQEFRIQTSTYAPEFGRTPGAQIQILTRSGTSQFHGTVFDYFRNDALDANDWFANRDGLAKPPERQNDFGGTFSGPIIKNRTFFFMSYEGLRLRLPQVAETHVPSPNARMSAIPAVQPFLNAYPLPDPSAPDDNGLSPFNASYSNRSSLDAVSLRLDQRVSDKLNLFGRYNYSPSDLLQRPLGRSTNTLETSEIRTQTLTMGATWSLSREVNNDFRLNYSHVTARGNFVQDDFGGAVPLTESTLGFPSSFTTQNSFFSFATFDGAGGLYLGQIAKNAQRQWNIVDSLAFQRGSHSLKIGADYRRLAPSSGPPQYSQEPFFLNMSAAASGQLFFTILQSARGAAPLFQNLGIFAQDTWRVTPRLTLTYGLRWDIDYSPSSRNGLNLQAVTNFDDLSKLALAPDGAPIFSTRYANIAPRIGLAYQLSQKKGWEFVLRGGWGQFFDLATQEVGQATNGISYPFGASLFPSGGTFPLDTATATPPAISRDNFSSGVLSAFDPKLNLPYTLQWNLALEQALGSKQSISASYIGSVGRRLIQSEFIFAPNPNFASATLASNRGTSNYNGLQVQFQRRLHQGLQALASYTWAHSIDTASASSYGSTSNIFSRQLGANATRGPSDFDVRHAFSAGVTYDVPAPRLNAVASAVLSHWSFENVIQIRTAPPVDILDSAFLLFGNPTAVRPDLVTGIPVYLYGSQYPGGKILNNTPDQGGPGCLGPFCPPPADANGNPVRQGNLGRNALRGFGATQWDVAVHRDFPLHESVKLQFRVEMFNVLNHPNFGSPVADLSNTSQFGQSIQMLGQSLDGLNQGGGSFSPLYQIGGPRSIQLALKISF